MKQFLLVISIFLICFSSYGQTTGKLRVEFFASPEQQYGFDQREFKAFNEQYEQLEFEGNEPYFVAHKSVGYNQRDEVRFVIKNKKNADFSALDFKIGKQKLYVDTSTFRKDTISFTLPERKKDYSLEVFYSQKLIGKLNVRIYSQKVENVIIVPLVNSAVNKDSLEDYLNAIYIQAGIQFNVSTTSIFTSEEINYDLLSNPSKDNDRYTNQMIAIRDLYFETHPNADKKSHYLFIVPGFVNPEITGYMVRNKSIGFVKELEADEMHHTIARQLGFGLGSLNDIWKDEGPEEGSTQNLMDIGFGTHLTEHQWESIRLGCTSVSYYDDYEDVQTNNGIIAYYFWEEDDRGNINFSKNLLGAINRPFKKNQYSVYLDIDNFLFKPIFRIFGWIISILHILAFLILLFLSILFRRKLFARWRDRFLKIRVVRFFVRIINFGVFLAMFLLVFFLINTAYPMFEVNEGVMKNLNGLTLSQARNEIKINDYSSKLEEQTLGSEIVVKKGEDWYLKKRKQVLYFSLTQDGDSWRNCKYITDSDFLAVDSKNYREKAKSHYLVFDYLNEKGEKIDQRVFNHLGNDITQKLELNDPIKRILVFVNGYRPTSMSQSFEDNFADIQKNGLEFPNSTNKIYNFDRYDYWRPWNEIDVLFQNRINPAETFYADGHFSVSTSNHRSLIDFTSLSSIYPKRCKDKNHHVCKTTQVENWSTLWFKVDKKTVDLFNLKSNKHGFKQRTTNGKIAGRNLNQIFNELPNISSNDTLYIVAHSMGYAYALGIIEELRGKINFGGLYIIAPENASAGKVNKAEWQEVWQYGDDFESEKEKSPCLIDGVAPQTKVAGLSPEHRIFIPKEKYSIKGFYDSHFIGYYTWIFKIDTAEKGHIRQR